MENSKDKIKRFQRAMIEYYLIHGRQFLWRRTSDPWGVLLSELLLRKTTAGQVEKIFPILANYTPCELAEEDVKKIESILKPLGIFRKRAGILKAVAQEICSRGGVPADEKELMKLPGVGRYVANAVLCISYGVPKPLLDRNMIRVIQRVFGVQSKKKRPHTDKELWRFAESLVPRFNCKEFNWGVLDFASGICTAKSPKCKQCPLRDVCTYFLQNKLE